MPASKQGLIFRIHNSTKRKTQIEKKKIRAGNFTKEDLQMANDVRKTVIKTMTHTHKNG